MFGYLHNERIINLILFYTLIINGVYENVHIMFFLILNMIIIMF